MTMSIKQQIALADRCEKLCQKYFSEEEITEDEIIDFQTFCRNSIKLIKYASPSALSNAGLDVEIKSHF